MCLDTAVRVGVDTASGMWGLNSLSRSDLVLPELGRCALHVREANGMTVSGTRKLTPGEPEIFDGRQVGRA
jgi:hypothetical protein